MQKTRLNKFCELTGRTHQALADELGVKRQTAHRYCQPVGHKLHRRPVAGASEKLRMLTFDVIHVGNFADLVDDAAAAQMVAEIAARAAEAST